MRFSYVFGYLATLSVGAVLALPAPHHQNTPSTAHAVAHSHPLSVPHQSPSVVEAETTGLITPSTTSSSPKLRKRHLVETATTEAQHDMQIRLHSAQKETNKVSSNRHKIKADKAMADWQEEFKTNGHSNTPKADRLYEEHRLHKHLEKHYDELSNASEAGVKYHESRKQALLIAKAYEGRQIPAHEQARINHHNAEALEHRKSFYMHDDLAHKACLDSELKGLVERESELIEDRLRREIGKERITGFELAECKPPMDDAL
ncbi:hypothetical protein FRC17_010788 [Serendipita sp. 399]|nr:hypothetical protein FRC17_010788 [Serendipita sp. 399]